MKIKCIGSLFFLSSFFLLNGNRFTHQARMTQDRGNAPQADKKKKTKPSSSPSAPRKWFPWYTPPVSLSQMDYQQLTVAKEKNKKANDWHFVIKCLNRMIVMCEDLAEKADLTLELADILFEQQQYEEAAKWYGEFTQAHPGNKKIEYASYRAIVCASKKMLSIDRDQSATEKTLELTQDFLKRSDVFKQYKKEVQQIQRHCYETLAQSDCNVAEFYLTYGNYQAAEQRLKSIRSEWLEKAPAITPKLAHLEVELAAVFPQFHLPPSSITVAELKTPHKKASMTTRF